MFDRLPDRLVNVPNVQPPLPSDFQVHATHAIHHIPYQVASFWDRGLRDLVDERNATYTARRKKAAGVVPVAGARAEVGKVPKELRTTAKRTPAVKSWLRVLEEPVRDFMIERGVAKPAESSEDEMDSEDEEIVFVGRNGTMRDGAMPKEKGWKKARREHGRGQAESGLVLDSLGDDEAGAFKYAFLIRTDPILSLARELATNCPCLRRRWLTHSISDYYGLESRSVTVGKPSRRVVYVGIKQVNPRHGSPRVRSDLPPPLWELF